MHPIMTASVTLDEQVRKMKFEMRFWKTKHTEQLKNTLS